MRYYFTLVLIFLLVLAADLYAARLFMGINISFSLAFLSAVAFVAPKRTRFIYRSMFPLIFVCGLAADSMSGLIPGITFASYAILALVLLEIAKNMPGADNVWMFILVIFSITLLFRVLVGFFANRLDAEIFLPVITTSFMTAVITTAGAAIFASLFETKLGGGIAKIIFNSEA